MTLALTATLALRPVGAFFFGGIADRFGRRLPMVVNLSLFAVVELLATGFAHTFVQFLLIRAVSRRGDGRAVGRGRFAGDGKSADTLSRRTERAAAAGPAIRN